jgi:hypothetical protein
VPSFVPLGRYKVTYLDGREEEVRSNFADIMRLEADLPSKDTPDGTSLAHGVWLYLGKPKGDIMAWAGDVHRIEPLGDEPEPEPDPTPPAAGDD